jgi:hypothetical protein
MTDTRDDDTSPVTSDDMPSVGRAITVADQREG